MEDFSNFMFGAAIGAIVTGVVAYRIKGGSSSNEIDQLKREINQYSNELEKLQKRNTILTEENNSLNQENASLIRKTRKFEDDKEDSFDKIDNYELEIKRLIQENNSLKQKLQEYETICESYKIEINRLKNKQ